MRRTGLPVERLSDEALLAGLASRDPELSRAFVRRFQGRVFAVALAVLGDPGLAEDVTQHVFERVWRHAHMYDARRGGVRTWVAAITRNRAIDVARVRQPVPVEADDLALLLQTMTRTPQDAAVTVETGAELRRCLALLPAEQARAVVLTAVYGLSAREVAEHERIPLGTAKSRIRAALEKLRASLTPVSRA